MSFYIFILQKLTSNDRVDRHFAYLISLLFLNTLIYILFNPPLGSLICSISIGIILLCIYVIYKQNSFKINEICKFIIYALINLTLITYFEGSNEIQRLRDIQIWDKKLINIDTFLLGNLFPKGQISLYLDKNINTTQGKIYSEILQLFYISYYFWGNCLGLYLLYTYYFTTEKLHKRMIYRLILMFCTSWIGTFALNLLFNLIFPAVSPRIYLQEEYKNEIKGLYFCSIFRNALTIAAANTYGAFPSAHSALSWLVPIFAYRMNMQKYAVITFIAAIGISTATIVMRYHYFVDFLAGLILTIIGTILGGFHTQKCFNQSLELHVLGIKEFNINTKINDDIIKV
jgi:membrane-associated phospholipid phosphatase